ncbi:MAG: AMP-binding protein [Candidatus Promineifilaceae bacterium]
MSILTCEGLAYRYAWIRDQFDRNSAEITPYTRQTLTFCQRWLQGEQTFTTQTSGSTGKPKRIKLYRDQMIASARLTGQAVGLVSGDRALVCLNTAYIAGIMMLVRGFELGLRLDIIEPTSNPLQHIVDKQVEFTAIVPLQVQATLNNAAERQALNRMKAVLVGGAPVSPSLVDALQTVDAAVYHTYGMTETVSHVALRRLNGAQASDSFVPQPTVDLSLDARGCLQICGPVTAQQLITTNDRVAFQPDGTFLWLGRIDNVINSGGVKVQAEKVETVLQKLLPGQRIFVTGLPDAKLGERVTAFVEGRNLQLDLETLLASADGLTKYERPRELYVLNQFAETPTGKIDRAATIRSVEIT